MKKDKHVKNVLGVSLVIFCLYTMSGGFYLKIAEPGRYVRRYGHVYEIDPDMNDQTSLESSRAFLCNVMTTTGLFIVHHAGKKQTPMSSKRYLLIGFGLMCIGLMGGYYLLEMKRSAVPVH